MEKRPIRPLQELDHLQPAWLRHRCILLCLHGSRAYGTSLPSSDTDLKGVAIAPKPLLLGFGRSFEQAQSSAPDVVVYELRKFMRLAADCNPNIIELLWVDQSCRLFVHPLAQRLLENRQLFLSKRARFTFSGYAMSQLKRIQTHRRWLLEPPRREPQREDFGLPPQELLQRNELGVVDALVREKLDTWDPAAGWEALEPAMRLELRQRFERILEELQLGTQTRWASAATHLGFSTEFIDLLQRERQLREARRQWQQFLEWKSKRNAARAAIEARFGYDTKHAMHLVRLMRMCLEIVERAEVRVRRPDAKELLAIRQGEWSYEALLEWAAEQEARIEAACKLSTAIPERPDMEALEALCVELTEASFELAD